MQKLNDSLAKEPISTQDTNKRATRMLDTKNKKTDRQSIVKDIFKHLNANRQRSYCSFSLNMSAFWWHLRWLENWAGLLSTKEENTSP